jgi:hypothetical protein
MGAFVECLAAGTDPKRLPVEDGRVEWSEMLSSGATTAKAVTGEGFFFTVTADQNGYFAIGAAPDSAQDPRHRIVAGLARSFAVRQGDRAHFTGD